MSTKKYLNKLYIAYGSNLNKEQMQRRCPDAIPVTEALLSDYQLKFMGNSKRYGVLNIIPKKGCSVPIVLWKITKADEESLDQYEGYPFLYEKKYFTCDVDGTEYKCMAYIMTENYNEPAMPTVYYYDVVAAG